ncbi:MAG: glycosyltransferase [Sphingomonadaceae bacterium]|nr:glycosyltransferase [Sphingomonadaceae bacterium]
MQRPPLLFVSNALDDTTRAERGITTDSPAASRKVFMACAALRSAGVNAIVLSLGRGGDRTGKHREVIRRVGGVPVVYCRFDGRPGWSQIVSALAPIQALWRLRRRRPLALFYNRPAGLVPALAAARLMGLRAAFDLEDGAVERSVMSRLVQWAYDALSDRALLACKALAGQTRIAGAVPYYGVVDSFGQPRDWSAAPLRVLLGGSLMPETGAPRLAAAIAQLRAEGGPEAARLAFDITGQGVSLPLFETLAAQPGTPQVTVHGRASFADYNRIVAQAHVGLALKPNGGPLAYTTFPSKVVEMAGAGLLVLSTDISDVRLVLGEGARYLKTDGVEELVDALSTIAREPEAARLAAETGAARVRAHFALDRAGQLLRAALFGHRG